MSKFGLESLSSSQVSRAAKLLDEELEAWRNRPLGRDPLSASRRALREGPRGCGSCVTPAVLSAIGIGPDQRRRVLGVSCRHLRGRGPLACLPGEPRCPWHARRGLHRLRRSSRPGGRAQGRPRRRQLAALPVPPGSERHPPRPKSRHPQAYRKGAAPGLGRRRPQGRRGRAGAPGGKLPRQGRQTRPLARGRDPRRPHRLLVARAPPQAHANLEPHRAIHPAGDQAPNRQGSGSSQTRPPSNGSVTAILVEIDEKWATTDKPYISWKAEDD